MRDFTDDLGALRRRLDDAARYLNLEGLKSRLAELTTEVEKPDLWDDGDHAKAVNMEYGRVSGDVQMIEGMQARLDDTATLYEMAVEEADESQEEEIADAIGLLERDLDALELRSLFSGEYDENDAVCEVHAGEGGTDAQDWAEMMLRMYQRWAERRGFTVEVEDVTEGQEAGILSTTFLVKGRYAYGLLSSERGVHRLYRISPFDSAARRQTSYAAVDVVPLIDDAGDEVKIDEKDLKIDTYRSSGAGGQHVNVTDSAVRITHLPTGVVTSCQNERSQLQNKAKAMQVLVAKLAERQREERRAELAALSGPRGQVSREGTIIRAYVLAPYQLVKDERTACETGNVQAVLDGDLDQFMEAWLQWRRSEEGGGGDGAAR